MTFAPVIVGINWALSRCMAFPLATQPAGSSPPPPGDGLALSPSNDNRTTLEALRESVRRLEPPVLDFMGWCPDCECPFVHRSPR